MDAGVPEAGDGAAEEVAVETITILAVTTMVDIEVAADLAGVEVGAGGEVGVAGEVVDLVAVKANAAIRCPIYLINVVNKRMLKLYLPNHQ